MPASLHAHSPPSSPTIAICTTALSLYGAAPPSYMKTASFFLCAAALVLASASCGKHTWKETQVLHEGMHKDHSEVHPDAYSGPADHAGKKEH
jgi:hypothetical protein